MLELLNTATDIQELQNIAATASLMSPRQPSKSRDHVSKLNNKDVHTTLNEVSKPEVTSRPNSVDHKHEVVYLTRFSCQRNTNVEKLTDIQLPSSLLV